MPDRRYPLDSLMKATGLTEYALGRKIGLSGTPLKKARELGLVEARADRAAVACGLTPWLVWPDWLADTQVECAERSCTNRFVPLRRNHVYCSPACRWRDKSRERYRRKYRTDLDFAERERARVLSYQSDPRVAEVRRIKQRARDRSAA